MLLPLLAHAAIAETLQNLHADNFDRVIEQHEYVLVHFWAPGALRAPHAHDCCH
jgi:hypothetical protein